MANPFRYHGYYYDTETKLYYQDGEYYNPDLAQFIDSSESNSGIDAVSANLFAYCSNNPVMFTDETGHKLLNENATVHVHSWSYLAVRASASDKAREIGKIFNNERVEIKEYSSYYSYVKYYIKSNTATKEGWVHSKYLARDKTAPTPADPNHMSPSNPNPQTLPLGKPTAKCNRFWDSLSPAQISAALEAMKVAGFNYDWTQGISYTRHDSWQSGVGYCNPYDWGSTNLLRYDIIEKCVEFSYHGYWRIELWKGDYWGSAGAEIGIYKSTLIHGFYWCATDNEMYMSFMLWHGNTLLFSRYEKHWWLTGFKLFADLGPSDLTMRNATIDFENSNFAEAFYRKYGNLYGYNNIGIDVSVVTIYSW